METPERIEVEGRTRVAITWPDGRRDELSARLLRGSCMCATCRDERGAAATRAVLAGPAPIEIAAAHLVGAYGVNFVFHPDGHATGIFSFDQLRALGDAVPD